MISPLSQLRIQQLHDLFSRLQAQLYASDQYLAVPRERIIHMIVTGEPYGYTPANCKIIRGKRGSLDKRAQTDKLRAFFVGPRGRRACQTNFASNTS